MRRIVPRDMRLPFLQRYDLDMLMTDNPLFGRRTLVVEDEMLVLMLIEEMLADLGCMTVSAATVDQALAQIVGTEFDAAMLDLNLNGEVSYPVADALAARGVPFVFSTGYGVASIQDSYRHRPVLKKPYRFQDLANVLERLFRVRIV